MFREPRAGSGSGPPGRFLRSVPEIMAVAGWSPVYAAVQTLMFPDGSPRSRRNLCSYRKAMPFLAPLRVSEDQSGLQRPVERITFP